MTDFTYNVWQDPDDDEKYGFTVSFAWGGDTYSLRGYRPSPTQCWRAACDFMLMVCKWQPA